ncbi:hypothetical protein PN4B1_02770 [Paenibacillus naphthalenovorans]|nr:hypothetical protein PN4B1_02770 [Paenibacillus naphthalenovorans]
MNEEGNLGSSIPLNQGCFILDSAMDFVIDGWSGYCCYKLVIITYNSGERYAEATFRNPFSSPLKQIIREMDERAD